MCFTKDKNERECDIKERYTQSHNDFSALKSPKRDPNIISDIGCRSEGCCINRNPLKQIIPFIDLQRVL